MLDYLDHAPFIEVKALAQAGSFEGYGAVFTNTDLKGDIIEPGAFRRTLSEHKAQGTMPIMAWWHDLKDPVGDWTSMEEDARGLYVKGQLWIEPPSPDPVAMKIYRQMKANPKMVGLSIGYQAVNYTIDEMQGVRRLTDVNLVEVSPNLRPVNEQAHVTQVKAVDAFPTIRQFERALKERLGLSGHSAKLVAAKSYEALLARDEHKGDTPGEQQLRDEEVAADLAAFMRRTWGLSAPTG